MVTLKQNASIEGINVIINDTKSFVIEERNTLDVYSERLSVNSNINWFKIDAVEYSINNAVSILDTNNYDDKKYYVQPHKVATMYVRTDCVTSPPYRKSCILTSVYKNCSKAIPLESNNKITHLEPHSMYIGEITENKNYIDLTGVRADMTVNDVTSINKAYDSAIMNVTSRVRSHEVFNKYNDKVMYDSNDSLLFVDEHLDFKECATINVVDSSYSGLNSSNIKTKSISMKVSGQAVKPDLDYTPEDSGDGSSANLVGFNYRCQKNSYFEINLVMGEPIKEAEDLPKGVTFTNGKIRGSIQTHGEFKSRIKLYSNTYISLIFNVDIIRRIM